MVSKPEIRKQAKQRRNTIGDEAQAEFDGRITARCERALDWGQYRQMMVFLPIEHRDEVNTWPLLQWIWQQWPGLQTYVPRVVGDELEAVCITDDTAFAPGAFGVPEPVGGAVLGERERLDMVLTPLLGFDLQGNRVGYGRGYFDRFFARYPGARRVGVGYECLLVSDGVAAEPYDIRLHAVITEERMYSFPASA